MERTALFVNKLKLKNVKNEISFSAYANSICTIISKSDELLHNLVYKLLNNKNKDYIVSYYDHRIDKEKKYIMNFLGYMTKDLPGFKKIKVKEYFEYSSTFYQGDFLNKALELIKYFNINEESLLRNLNYENKKIISFIDSIYFEPEIVILEDPFTNIGNINVVKMIRKLEEIKQNGFSVIITNPTNKELNICDNILLLTEDGISNYKKSVKNDKYKVSFTLDEISFKDTDIINSIGCENLIITKHKVNFKYKGNTQDLLLKLSKLDLKDLNIESVNIYEILGD